MKLSHEARVRLVAMYRQNHMADHDAVITTAARASADSKLMSQIRANSVVTVPWRLFKLLTHAKLPLDIRFRTAADVFKQQRQALLQAPPSTLPAVTRIAGMLKTCGAKYLRITAVTVRAAGEWVTLQCADDDRGERMSWSVHERVVKCEPGTTDQENLFCALTTLCKSITARLPPADAEKVEMSLSDGICSFTAVSMVVMRATVATIATPPAAMGAREETKSKRNRNRNRKRRRR